MKVNELIEKYEKIFEKEHNKEFNTNVSDAFVIISLLKCMLLYDIIKDLKELDK